jgi:hypothetical protein
LEAARYFGLILDMIERQLRGEDVGNSGFDPTALSTEMLSFLCELRDTLDAKAAASTTPELQEVRSIALSTLKEPASIPVDPIEVGPDVDPGPPRPGEVARLGNVEVINIGPQRDGLPDTFEVRHQGGLIKYGRDFEALQTWARETFCVTCEKLTIEPAAVADDEWRLDNIVDYRRPVLIHGQNRTR